MRKKICLLLLLIFAVASVCYYINIKGSELGDFPENNTYYCMKAGDYN